MKKLLAFMIVLCLWVPLCAFKDVTSGALIGYDGSVNEVVTIKYSSEDAEKLDLSFNELHTAVLQITNSIQSNLQAKFQNRVKTEAKLVEDNIGQFAVNITYETKDEWDSFCQDVIDKAEETTETSFFIKNYVTKMPVKLSTITYNQQELSLVEYVNMLFNQRLSQKLDIVFPQTVLSTKYSYVYATNIVRLHSDAKETEYNPNNGLTYYLWEFDIGEPSPQITFWQTRANAVSWYCLALGLTAVLGVTLFVCTKSKKQKKDTEKY